jgi:D-glycerate 3-kinase
LTDWSPLDWIDAWLRAERLPAAYRSIIEQVHVPLADRIARHAARRGVRPHVVGLCGPQGSGKSTMVASLKLLLENHGLRVVVLSLDDLYLTRAQRMDLARRVHPLLQTRGVPGTHAVDLGLEVIARLSEAALVPIPSFDKARDERRPAADWPRVQGPADVLLFEGWCMGARPQPQGALAAPVNELEREEDSEGIWRHYVNEALAGEYQRLFASLDELVLLQAPDFAHVYGWRLEQERKLRARLTDAGADASGLMDERQLSRFIQHFERLTRHIMAEMPQRADTVIPVQRV